MKGLILAAGMGNRLGDLTRSCPKALVNVNGRPLLSYCLDFLSGARIEQVIVAGGYFFGQLKKYLNDVDPAIVCVENRNYELGNIESLFAAREFVQDNFIMCNADHIYRAQMGEILLENLRGITALCDFDRTLGPDDMKVKLDGTGGLKAIRKDMTVFDGGYIGITVCPRGHGAAYWKAALTTREKYGKKSCVEWILATLAESGYPVHIADGSRTGWAEIDTVEDLVNAEQFLST